MFYIKFRFFNVKFLNQKNFKSKKNYKTFNFTKFFSYYYHVNSTIGNPLYPKTNLMYIWLHNTNKFPYQNLKNSYFTSNDVCLTCLSINTQTGSVCIE